MATKYRIEQIFAEDIEHDQFLVDYLKYVGMRVGRMYGDRFDWRLFRIRQYAASHRLMVCYKDTIPVGVMLCRTFPSVFDFTKTICYQDLLYAESGTRAAKMLMDDFIDFGRRNANHVITMIAEHSNVKPRTLAKHGFKKLETLYRMET